jgi:hypothetical protein
MAEKTLTLNQQIALLPAAIPDAILDFLEDFQYPTPLQTEAAQSAFDPEYLKVSVEAIKGELEKIRADLGKFVTLSVDQLGRDVPGGFALKLGFEKGVKGIGILTKMKERTIFRVIFQAGEFNEAGLKELLKNPPK